MNNSFYLCIYIKYITTEVVVHEQYIVKKYRFI
jgi:hypothetical protein